MYHTFFIYSSVDGHLSCFHDLAIVNNVTVSTGVHVAFWIMVFSGYMPNIGIAESYGSSIFSYLQNLHTIIHSGYMNLHSHQQCKRVPLSPQPLQHLLLVDFLVMAILTDGNCNFSVVLICISLIISSVAYLFMFVGDLYVFFGKMFIWFSHPFFDWVVCFWYWDARCCCLVTKSCLILLWLHGLLPAGLLCPWDFPGKNTGVGCHFLLWGIFQTQELNLRLGSCCNLCYVLPVVPSKSFIVSGLHLGL